MKTGEMIKDYTLEGNGKLDGQYSGTQKAIRMIAEEKVKDFMLTADVGLGKSEREQLAFLIAGGMMQSFSLGYGVGKVEGLTHKQVYL